MIYEDEGYLLSKRKFRENANIINVFTSKYGKMSGIVYGGNSRKIRNYLQISNKIFIFYTAKNENKIGYFKTELIKPVSPKYFNDKRRTTTLLSLTSLLSLLLPDLQPNNKIYISLEKLIENFNYDNCPLLYIFWELNLIKELGFDPNFKDISKNFVSKNNLVKLNIDGINYIIPTFILTNTIPETYENSLIKKSLIFTRSLMSNKFFLPNNLILPRTRVLLESYFN